MATKNNTMCFGVSGKFTFKGKSFSAYELTNILCKKLHMNAIIQLPHNHPKYAAHKKQFGLPQCMLVPDGHVDRAEMGVNRRHCVLLPFSSFLSILTQHIQLSLLKHLKFPDTVCKHIVKSQPQFCLSGSLHYLGIFISHEFVRNALHNAGFNVKEDCSRNLKSVLIGDFNQSTVYGQHANHLTICEFLAFQPRVLIKPIHIIMKGAVQLSEAHAMVTRQRTAAAAAKAKKSKSTSAPRKLTHKKKKKITAKKTHKSKSSSRKMKGRRDSDSDEDNEMESNWRSPTSSVY
jgi:hypothetical protein